MFAILRAPLSGACAGAAPPAAGTRAKAKGHFKRASEVMAAVREDAIARTFVKMAGFRPPLPDFRVGDAVEVLYAQELAEAKPLAVKGTVVSMPRKGIDAKFTIINNMDGEWFMSTYVTSSPLLRGVRILQRNRVTEGVRLARRARLTYLKEINPNVYTVDDSTKDASVRLEEKEEKRRLAKSGRKLAKETKRSGGGLEEEGGAPAAKGGKAAPAAAPAKGAPAAKAGKK